MKKITVYIFDTDTISECTEVKLQALKSNIAPYYLEKYNRCIKANNIKTGLQELAAGFLLSKYLGVSLDSQLFFGEHGKPELISGDKFFNLSHSGHYVVLAVADRETGPVGIDIERTDRMSLSVAKKMFSEDVVESLRKEEESAAGFLFAKHWTTCEARLKLSGEGMQGYKKIKCDYSDNDSDVTHILLDNEKYIMAIAVKSDISACAITKKTVQYY